MAANETGEVLSLDEADHGWRNLHALARRRPASSPLPANPSDNSCRAPVASTESAERLRVGHRRPSSRSSPRASCWMAERARRPDAALGELAGLLHAHLIGELRLTGDPSVEQWHTFLMLLARPPEDVRSEGGIARAWMAAGGESG